MIPPVAPSNEIARAGEPAPVSARPLRLRHVDSLRAVAALLVIWLHFDQILAPLTAAGPKWLAIFHALPRYVDPGRTGVMIFFAISGFVICRSFDGLPGSAARRFVIRRFCRLYPAFWVSLLGGFLVSFLLRIPLDGSTVAANFTMAPGWFGRRYLLGVYWTLEIELIFYALCLGLYGLRWLDRPLVFATGATVLAWLPRALRAVDRFQGTHLTLSVEKLTLTLGLSVMCWGALFRLAYDGTAGFRRWPPRPWCLLLTAFVALELMDVPDPDLKWTLLGLRHGTTAAQGAVVCAVLAFVLWIAVLRIEGRALCFLGVISYSLYLFHLPVLVAMQRLLEDHRAGGWPVPPSWLCAAVAVGATVLLAAGVYRWVERPAILLGKRWTGMGRAPGNAA